MTLAFRNLFCMCLNSILLLALCTPSFCIRPNNFWLRGIWFLVQHFCFMTILVTSSLSFHRGFPVAFMLGLCSVLSCSRFRVRCSHDVTQSVAIYPSDLASSLGATASAPRECGFIWLCGPLLGPLIQPSDAWPPRWESRPRQPPSSCKQGHIWM